MSDVFPPEGQVAYARKEMAYRKWEASRYTDHEAYHEFEKWRAKCQEVLNAINTRAELR